MLNRNIDLFIIPSFLFRLGFRKSAVDGPILSILPKYFKNKGYFEKKDQSLKKKYLETKKPPRGYSNPLRGFSGASSDDPTLSSCSSDGSGLSCEVVWEQILGYDTNIDDLVKSLKLPLFVIPAKTGSQYFQLLINTLDSGFHRSDDFLRSHRILARLNILSRRFLALL
jgi:hypothetical protein